MRPFFLASATALLLAAPLPAAAQNADWTGLYAGGRLGYTSQPEDKNETIQFDTNLDGSFGDTVSTVTGADAFSPGFCGGAASSARTTGCSDRDGTEWAGHIGYDYQFGDTIVVGLVGEYGRAYIKDSVTAFSTTPAFYTFTRELRDTAALRARAGANFGGTLIYGTGGVAYGKIRRSFATSNTANTFTETDGDDKAWGYRVGGGVEQLISNNFSIGVQYLHTSLKDDEDYTVRAGGANVPVSNPFIRTNAMGTDFSRTSRRFKSNSVSVVASFRF